MNQWLVISIICQTFALYIRKTGGKQNVVEEKSPFLLQFHVGELRALWP
jgi:hypothetical protein